jgi:hypothetical protein
MLIGNSQFPLDIFVQRLYELCPAKLVAGPHCNTLDVSARFGAAITEFIEWRTFAYWVRLVVEIERGVSCAFGRPALGRRAALFLGGIAQDSAHGSAPDPELAGDLSFGDASAM